MPGPWEKYAQADTSTDAKPWEKYSPTKRSPADLRGQVPDYSSQWTPQQKAQVAAEEAAARELYAPETPMQQLGRNALMQLRALSQGAASLGGIVIDPITQTANVARHKLGFTDPAYDIPTLGTSLDTAYNMAGVPNPQPRNTQELIAQRVAGGLGGVVGGVGVGNALRTVANPTVAAIGSQLAEAPGAQALSATTGATAGALAQSAGLGPKAQLAAQFLGGLAPSAGTLASSAAKAAVRGSESNIPAMEQRMQDFKQMGIQPTASQIAGTGRARAVESIASKLPGSNIALKQAAERQAQQASQGIEQTASMLSPNRDVYQTGRKIVQGLTGDDGFFSRFKNRADQLYSKLDEHIPANTRIDVSNTTKVLPELNRTIEGAPNTSEFFKNQRIASMFNALKEDISGYKAALTRPEVQEGVQRIKQGIASHNEAIDAANAAEKARVDQANMARIGSGEPLKFTPQPKINPAQEEEMIRNFAQSQADNKIPYEALKKLRTVVGEELENSSVFSDVPKIKWKALYAAVSQDLEKAAKSRSPEAKNAFERASNFYRSGMKRLDTLSDVVDKNGGPEAVYKAATSGTQDGATKLRAVMQSLDKDGQKALAATIIRRLGRAVPSAQDAEGGTFSMQTFLTNWNKLSPQAKDTIMNRFGKSFRDKMESMARVAQNYREGAQYLANPSGTGAAMANIGALSSAAGTAGTLLATGHPFLAGATALGAGAAVGGNYLLGRALASPGTTNWLLQRTRQLPSQVGNITSGTQNYLNQLSQQRGLGY